MVNLAIHTHQLIKQYKGRKVVDEVSISVKQGEIVGLLGPNGAGKTTTVRILATLLKPDSGRASVAGIDVLNNPDEVRKVIGLSGQYAAVDEILTGYDNLVMFGKLYHLGAKNSVARANELLERFSLTDSAKRPIKTYSGAASLIVKPKVLFLDEPTTGLDPRGRIDMWGVIKELVNDGTTLILTTQYLEEADNLANEIAVIDTGKVIARGTADELKRRIGGEHLEVVVQKSDVSKALEIIEKISGHKPDFDDGLNSISAPVQTGTSALVEVINALSSVGINPLDVALKRPSLDDVFLALTGHKAEV